MEQKDSAEQILKQIPYEIVYSARKTLAVQVKADGSVVVRAPKRMAKYKIESFLKEKQDWILSHRERALAASEQKKANGLTEAERPGTPFARLGTKRRPTTEAVGSSATGSAATFGGSSVVDAGAGKGPSPATVGTGAAEEPSPALEGGTGSTSALGGAPTRPPRSSTSSACAICSNSTLIQQNHTYPHI